MLSQTTLTFCIAGVTILGGFLAALVAVNFMDLCSKPGERRRQIEVAATAGRRQIELAATRNMCTDVRIETLEKLFPTNKKYQPKERDETDEEDPSGEIESCAICIEPFQQDDIVMECLGNHHQYHRTCMMEWLKHHSNCPDCRKRMWTHEAFIEAKKQVFKENPEALKKELEAAEAVEDMVEQVTFEEEAVAAEATVDATAEAAVEATAEQDEEQSNDEDVKEAEELC